MPTFNIKQVIVVTLLSMIFIWVLRLGSAGDDGASVERNLAPLELAEVTQKASWEAKDLRERLLVFVPAKKRPSAAEQQAAARAAQLAAQQAAAAAPPPIDKTVKPMFSQLDDDHQVGLIAIIDSDANTYAVLQKINFASKQNQNIKLGQAESFEGWTVSIESQTRVVLHKSERKIYLNLFKPGNI